MNKIQIDYSPNISVIMPIFNGARTLTESVNSVLQQTYRDFELIICNDASTDETVSLLNSIDDKRVRVIHNSDNIGQGLSKDRAIAVARGTWLAFIDSDDSWAPERLEVMLRETNSSLDKMIFDDIWECHDTPSGMIPWQVLRGRHAFGSNGVDAIDVPIKIFVCLDRWLIKPLLPIRYIREHNICHSSRPIYEDNEFFLKILSFGLKLIYIAKPMYYYRITPGSMSGLSNRHVFWREILEEANQYFTHAPDVQKALKIKMAMVSRNERYIPFIWALKSKEFIKALRLIWRSPWIVREFFSRLGKSSAYQIHRFRHGGRSRGFR
jgi:succinoglycan biosynthesis protein ExoO